jgi:hypothetical protein
MISMISLTVLVSFISSLPVGVGLVAVMAANAEFEAQHGTFAEGGLRLGGDDCRDCGGHGEVLRVLFD